MLQLDVRLIVMNEFRIESDGYIFISFEIYL